MATAVASPSEFLVAAPPEPRPEPQRDRYGRYLIPHPETGEVVAWTRATTFASAIADQRGIENWRCRMTAVGIARRPDLLAAVASVAEPTSEAGKKALGAHARAAQEHAGTTVRATIGTAIHAWAEALDTGRKVSIPEPWRADVEAYREALSGAGVTVSERYVERICLLPELGVAGTMDRLVRMASSLVPVVGDIKTGADLGYSWVEIAIQLALYAHSSFVWDPRTETMHRMPELNKLAALVCHVPAGEGRCQLHLVDIKAAWPMVEVCKQVREWRQRKDLAVPLERPEMREAAPIAAAEERNGHAAA
ncbi:MAG: hypothetical protein M3024_12720 [Candidatus Dormibacteraeota bacterium]|nr:hypothetical protein [Candidatus Dormibacteraeota bacterium]